MPTPSARRAPRAKIRPNRLSYLGFLPAGRISRFPAQDKSVPKPETKVSWQDKNDFPDRSEELGRSI